LEGVLKETYGIFVYQEQVMQAAQVLAGYSLGEADLLRRAMGKKIQSEMDAQRARFIEGCAANDIDAAKANELFDLIDKFAGYGFNKSHAAAYALVAYHTAWLKTHHPAEFFAASMSFDMAQTDKLALFVEDMRRSGIECLPPDVNASRADFSVEESQEGLVVRYALGALKGVGEKAMHALVAERQAGGAFKSLDDFAERIDPKLLNRRQLESLAAAGAFDRLNADRPTVFGSAETILAHAQAAHDQRTSGQHGLFGGGGSTGVAPIRLAQGQRWSLAERMNAEREAFGFFFSAHPVDAQRHLLAAHKVRSFAELATSSSGEGRSSATMAGLVEGARWRVSAKGRRFLTATISDASGQYEATAFDDEPSADLEAAAKSGECGLLSVELDRRPGDDVPRITVKRFQPLDGLARKTRLLMELRIADGSAIGAVARELAEARGGNGVIRAILPVSGEREARLVLGRDFRLDADLAARLSRILGEGAVDLSAQEPPRLALVG
ncbi:MAG: DNA polymerase III subunit alpha, partial [Sphingomonas sp.]|nr:DNA polymerase III subunit alpha [Sphingomonas sp.]